jgi:hypothetical protein
MLKNLDTVIAFATVMLLLSLLVTTIVQMIVSLLDLRGKCLLDGTEQLLKQLYPELNDQARAIAEKVLRHPAVGAKSSALSTFSEDQGGAPAEGKTGLALAIRPEELILVLKDLMEKDSVLKTQLQGLFTDTPGRGSPEMIAKAEELLKKLEGQFPPNQAQNLKNTVESVLGTTQSIVVKVDAWFNTVMDRTSEAFATYTRKITVGVAILFALLLHIDSLAILSQVSKDDDLRARLVQMSDTAQADAKKAIELEESPLAAEAIQKLAQDAGQTEIKKAVDTACGQTDVKTCLSGQKTREEGERWLGGHGPQDPQQKQEILAAYGQKFTEVTQVHLQKLNSSFQTLQSHLRETQLEIIPNPVPGVWDFKGGRNFLGVVMTAFFLSLGAPFWYNTLRKLSDLRPVVARRVDGEPLNGAPKPGS